MKKLLLPLVLVAATAASFAQPSAAGTWTGRVQFNLAEITKGMNAEQKKAVQQQLAEAAKLTFSLAMRPNNTFVMTFSPPASAKDQTRMQIEGKWLQKGRSITLTPTRQNGKAIPAKDQQPQTISIATDGKTMRWSPGKDARQGTIVFTRQR